MKEYDLERRTFKFGVEVIKTVNDLAPSTTTFVLVKQVIRSATSINSNIVHAQSGFTRKDFIYFMNNTKKEAKETKKLDGDD